MNAEPRMPHTVWEELREALGGRKDLADDWKC